MKLFFSILLFTINSLIAQEKYELSICAIFQNEGKYLSEWIEFHLKQGVDHFYLYDNLSYDNPQKFIQKYIKKGIVEVIDWPYTYSKESDWVKLQCAAYLDCVNVNGNYTKWIAFIDTDEFLFVPYRKKLNKFLKKYENYGAVSAYWVMYGTSNVIVPDGKRITDYLLYRAKDDFPGHKIMKTIAQPKCIEDIVNPHFVVLGSGIEHKQFPLYTLRINHYWSRDLSFFFNVKLPRRIRWYNDVQKEINLEKNLNEVYDPILKNF